MKYNTETLYKIYARTKDIIQKDYNAQENFDHVNPFWANILSKRENFPSFTNTLSFLNNNSAFGLGKRMESDMKMERKSFDDAVLAVNKEKYEPLKNKLSESFIGQPKYFESDSIVGSTSFIENIVSTHRLIDAIDTHLADKEKINVLEIGAGWGAVMNQLIQYYGDRINKIAICDLHENLFISSFHLQAVFPDRKVGFVPKHESFAGQDNSLNFCSPNNIKNLDVSFDLVFNMISFQEMSTDVIDGYMQFIQKHLSDGGIVYSENGISPKNTSNRAKKASEYGYANYFEVLKLQNGQRFCPHLYFGNKHEIWLTNKQEAKNNVNPKHLDAICNLMNLRLDDNIDALKVNTVTGTNSPQEIQLLDLIHDFFEASDKGGKQQVLDKIQPLDDGLIHKFLHAHVLMSQRKFQKAMPLLAAIEPKLTGLVKVNILCYMGIIDSDKQPSILKKIEEISPEMLNTAIATFDRQKKSKKNMPEKISIQLHLDVKKWFGYSSYQLSFLPTVLKSRFAHKLAHFTSKIRQSNNIPYHLR